MKALVQRVKWAKVEVNNAVCGEIKSGLLILLGVGHEDNEKNAATLAGKIARLRIFEDNDGKMNLSLADTGGEALAVSQFTLMADTRKGNRPSFIDAARPEQAMPLYESFCLEMEKLGVKTARGAFGEHMEVSLLNDGPVTIMLEI